MKSAFLTSVVALIAGALPAAAVDFGNGLSLAGTVELEYSQSSGSSDLKDANADVTFGWRSQGGGALTFGADVNYVYFRDLDSSDTIDQLWGGLVVGTSFGELTIGNPRPVLSAFLDSPELGGIKALDIQISALTSTFVDFFSLANDVKTRGIAFKGASGDLSYGASLHRLSDAGDSLNVLDLAASYKIGQVTVRGGYERLSDGSDHLDMYVVGADYAADRWSAGVLLSKGALASEDTRATKVYGSYAISDAFSVGAQVLRFKAGSSDSQTLYGLTSEYGFGQGGYAQLGAYDTSNSGSSAIMSASVGFRF